MSLPQVSGQPLADAIAAMGPALDARNTSPLITNPFGSLNPAYVSQVALGAGAVPPKPPAYVNPRTGGNVSDADLAKMGITWPGMDPSLTGGSANASGSGSSGSTSSSSSITDPSSWAASFGPGVLQAWYDSSKQWQPGNPVTSGSTNYNDWINSQYNQYKSNPSWNPMTANMPDLSSITSILGLADGGPVAAPPPGYGGTLPWQQPQSPAMGRPGSWAPQSQGPSALPPGVQMPNQNVSRGTPPPQLSNQSAIGGVQQAAGPQPMPQQGMANGGQVMHHIRMTPRKTPIFNQIMHELHLKKYEDGGAVSPVILRAGKAYAEGGLVQAANKVKGAGRWEDAMVVHLNPSEMRELAAKHGPPTINPETGLPEFGFFSFIGDVLKTVAPIAALAIPGVGEFLAPALEGLGIGATTAGILGSAIAGAGLGAITGGGKGALIGGLTGGFGSALGGPAAQAIQGLGIGPQTSQALVNAAIGAGGSAAAGGNPLQGALMSGAMSYFAPQTTSAIKNFFSPTTAATSTTPYTDVAGVEHTASSSPGNVSVSGIGGNDLSTPMGGASGSGSSSPLASAAGASGSTTSGSGTTSGLGLNSSTLLPLLLLASAAGGSSNPKVYTTTPPKTPTSTGFNPVPQGFSYGLQRNPAYDPTMAAMYPFMSNAPSYYLPDSTVPHQTFAHGGDVHQGALHMAAEAQPSMAAQQGFVRGPGSGKSDEVPAMLSNNEHVWAAQDVANLGDGDSETGHRRMEEIKKEVRKSAGQKKPEKPSPAQRKSSSTLVRDAKRKVM